MRGRRSGVGRPASRMIELQAILEAGYDLEKERDGIRKMMGLSKETFRVLFWRFKKLKRWNGSGAVEENDGHAACKKSDHLETPDGEIICLNQSHKGEVLGMVGVRREIKATPSVKFTNKSQWDNGLGSADPARTLGYWQAKKIERGLYRYGYAGTRVKELLCDVLTPPASGTQPTIEYGNILTNRAAEIALQQLLLRSAQRLIDEHECFLIVDYSIKAVIKETPFARRYVNMELLTRFRKRYRQGVTKSGRNKIPEEGDQEKSGVKG